VTGIVVTTPVTKLGTKRTIGASFVLQTARRVGIILVVVIIAGITRSSKGATVYTSNGVTGIVV
jgi:hypothetical protein